MFIHPSYRRWSGADERTVRARHPSGPVATGPYQGVHAFLVTCLIAVAAIATTARAQAPDLNEPSVTLAVSPSEVPVNGHVSISGLGYPQPGTPVSITVTGPSGSPTTASATPDKNGRYSLTFNKTPVAGDYAVSAQVGAKGTPANSTFTVKTYLIDIDEDVADNKSFLEDMKDYVTAVKKGIDDLPDSPARTDMEQKITGLEPLMEPLAQQSAQLASALGHYKDMVSQNPDAETTLQPFFDHLAQLDAETKARRKQADDQIKESEKNLQACDAIDHATVGLKAVPEIISLLKKPYEFVFAYTVNMAKSMAPPAASAGVGAIGKMANDLPKAASKPTESLAENELELGSETEIAEKLASNIPESVRSTPGYKFVVSETKKFVPSVVDGSKNSLDMFDKATKLAGDVAAFANDQLFAKYCEKFSGPFTATMTAHFYSKAHPGVTPVEWWTFSTEIKGVLTLRYPKGAEGQSVALSGQFEGGATRFTYKEDVFNSEIYGKMAKGGKVYLVDVPPAAVDNASGGMVNDMVSPTSFFVPVTGQMTDGKITVVLGEARSDFNDSYTHAHTVYVVIAPTTLMLPVAGHFSLPYMNAHFILDHIGKGDFVVQRAGESMVMQRQQNKDLPGPGNDAVYTIDLKACNPACGAE
jgi:hypothetical protein